MSRLKTFLMYVLLVVALYFFVDAMIYIGVKNMTKDREYKQQNEQTITNQMNNIDEEDNTVSNDATMNNSTEYNDNNVSYYGNPNI